MFGLFIDFYVFDSVNFEHLNIIFVEVQMIHNHLICCFLQFDFNALHFLHLVFG